MGRSAGAWKPRQANRAVTLRERVAAEVRAMVARRMLKARDLVPILGVSQPQVSARLRGDIEWSLTELEILADYFGEDVGMLLTGVRARRDSNSQPSDPKLDGLLPNLSIVQ